MENEKNLIKCHKCGSLTNKHAAECFNCGEPVENSRKTVKSKDGISYKEISDKFDLNLSTFPKTVVSSVLDIEDDVELTPLTRSYKDIRQKIIKKVMAFILPHFMLALHRKYVFLAITLALFIISAVLPVTTIGSIVCVFVLFLSSRIGLSVISSIYKSPVVFTSAYSNLSAIKEPIFKDAEKKPPSSKKSRPKKSIFKDHDSESSAPQIIENKPVEDIRENNTILALIMLPISIISIMLLINRFIISFSNLISFIGLNGVAILVINLFSMAVRYDEDSE